MSKTIDHAQPAGDHTRFIRITALLTLALTLLTFVIAILTPPMSGPFCQGGCFEYPYEGIASRFPRDYLWMYPAMLWAMVYLVLMTGIHYRTPVMRKPYSLAGFAFALMASALLFTNYFIQVTVIQPSLLNRETDGIALLSQFNPHGVFIALEEAGYLAMSISFIFLALSFAPSSGKERAIKWIFASGFVLVLLALAIISGRWGIHREYRFEVAVITIDWLTLIAGASVIATLGPGHLEKPEVPAENG